MVKHLKIIVSGRVQGVWFRQSTLEVAKELGLVGTVQNLPNGNVEIHAQGEEDALNKLLVWCRDGSKTAEVDKLMHSEFSIREYHEFKII